MTTVRANFLRRLESGCACVLGLWRGTDWTDRPFVAAALAYMRPSSASLRVKFAISESYCSYSGIFRARSSFGSFCKHRFCGLCKSEPLILGKHEPSADYD